MRDTRYPSIDGLRAFDAAARLGSFERAADELDITASAVSKRVATLEELLGTPLLVRSARALTLTAAGKEYLAQVGAALGLLAAVPLHQRAAQRAQRLRVRAPPTFARQVLVPELEQFTQAHPQIELEVVLSIPFLDSGASDADVEVRNGDAGANGATPLMHDVVTPLAAPALLARLPPLRQPADLAQAPLLRTPLEPWAPWFRAAGLAWPEPAQGPRLVDLGLTLEAAVGGQGIALARPSLARGWLASGVLRPLFDITAVPAHQYYLLPHAAQGAPLVFTQWLREVCERSAHDGLAAARSALSRQA
ncbi:MAG TPA: LysR family transcriptional regulator [Albitalea sp.]|nr:LysR family transcriptional regulator [Albitalea sp.]